MVDKILDTPTLNEQVDKINEIIDAIPISNNFLADGTVITVGTTGADFTTLADAYSYLDGKWSNGEVTISIITDLAITDSVNLNANTFNIPQLIIDGNNNYITITFTESGTYTPGFTVTYAGNVKIANINFVGSTNGATHILVGGYNNKNLYVINCTFDGAYGGAFAYQGADIEVEDCTFLELQVGIQGQQGGTARGVSNTFGSSTKKCYYAYSIYDGGILRVFDSTITNIATYSPHTRNSIVSAQSGAIFHSP